MKNIVCGLLTLALGVVYLIEARDLPRSALSDEVGASGFPVLIAWSLIVVAIFMLGQSALQMVARRKGAPVDDPAVGQGIWADPRSATLRAAGLAAITAGFLFLMPIIGYLASLMVMLTAVAVYQGKRIGREVATVAICGAVALWLLFVLILDISLPTGVFESLF